MSCEIFGAIVALIFLAVAFVYWWFWPPLGKCVTCHQTKAFPWSVVRGSNLLDEREIIVCRQCAPTWDDAKRLSLKP